MNDKKNKREGCETAWCFSFAEMVLYLVVPGSSSSATTDRNSMPTWFKKKLETGCLVPKTF